MAVIKTSGRVIATSSGRVSVGNCGTGAGGFKHGNTCAKGDDGADPLPSYPRGQKQQRDMAKNVSDDEFKAAGDEFEKLIADKEWSDHVVESAIQQGHILKKRPEAVRAFELMDAWVSEQANEEGQAHRAAAAATFKVNSKTDPQALGASAGHFVGSDMIANAEEKALQIANEAIKRVRHST